MRCAVAAQSFQLEVVLVDIVVKARHTEVSERFRRHAADKLAKLEKHDHRVIRIDVELSKEHNPRQTDMSERVELTVLSKGPVVRAEACAHDPFAAFELACDKLENRLRRAADRRRSHHGHGGHGVATLRGAPGGIAPEPPSAARDGGALNGSSPDAGTADGPAQADGDLPYDMSAGVGLQGTGPMVIRSKEHAASPMSLDQALYEMELVGHDFFLFVDKGSGRPSVVYRRRGYDYGVITLAMEAVE